jgi:excisionase family DNA binding protein
MELTTRTAAERLGVNQSRVRALVASGGLVARRMGSQWLVDADSVDRQAALTTAHASSRAMAARVAWASGDLADGGRAEWLTASERSRLRKRFASASRPEIVQRWLADRCDGTVRFRVGTAELAALLAEPDVVRTGISAASAYGCGLGDGGHADVYVARDIASRLVGDYFLVEGKTGNLTLRRMSENFHLVTARTMNDHRVAPRLVVGVDLADDTDARTRTAGHELLETVLPIWRRCDSQPV